MTIQPIESIGRPRILVVGNSHTTALKAALADRQVRGQGSDIRIAWMKKEGEDDPARDVTPAQALDLAGELGPNDFLFTTYLGATHNKLGLYSDGRDFSVVEPSAADLPAAEIIPTSVLVSMFREAMDTDNFVKRIGAYTKAQVFHFFPPPPKGDAQLIEDRLRPKMARIPGALSICPPLLRLQLWRIEIEVLGSLLAGWSVGDLRIPEGVSTKDGFLRPEFYARDVTHANQHYGELVLRQIEGVVAASSPIRRVA